MTMRDLKRHLGVKTGWSFSFFLEIHHERPTCMLKLIILEIR
jgi:hypothetical protein